MSDLPLHVVFQRRAQGLAHLMRDRVWRMTGCTSSEQFLVELDEDGPYPTLRYRRVADTDGCVEFGNITPTGVASVVYGEPVQAHSEPIGSDMHVIDNRQGVSPIPAKFAEVFGHTDTHSDSHKTGGSVQVQVKAQQKIAGGSVTFDEAITATATTEFASSTGSSDVHNISDETSIVVPVGKRVRITENRNRSDLVIQVKAQGQMAHSVAIGKHSGGKWKGGSGRGYGYWQTWEQFCETVRGKAPDNWDFATSLREHPPWQADLWALDPLQMQLTYEITLVGAVVAEYDIQAF